MNNFRFTSSRSLPCGRMADESQRRGAILIMVMVCLLLMSAIFATLFRMAVAQSLQAKQLERQTQAEQLAMAGLDRATARLATETGYTGESWTIPAETLGQSATVAIRVESADGDAAARAITAEAKFPSEGDRRAQVTLSRRLTLPSSAQGDQP